MAAPRRLSASRGLSARRRGLRGMTLVEIMVVLAIAVAVAAIAIPALSSYLQLEQRRVARELALNYEMLHDEAVLRNVTFRVAYHLDDNYYEIEVGDPDALVFSDPEARVRYEEEQKDKLKRFTKEEREAKLAETEPDFTALAAKVKTKVDLPRGTRFLGVYTPEYGDIVRASGDEDPEKKVVVYSYIFSNGFTEHTIVQLVDADVEDPEEGYSVEVEPLTGRVNLTYELVDPRDRFAWLPDRGPDVGE